MIRTLAVLGLAALVAACTVPRPGPGPAPAPPATAAKLTFAPASFATLPGWRDDRLAEALPALRASCGTLASAPGDRPFGGFAFAGTNADWAPFCAGLARATDPRALIERELLPVLAADNGNPNGLFTGYFEASLRASRQQNSRFRVPVLGAPPDLITVELGQFRDSLKGQRIAGRVVGSQLRPYDDRAAIEGGALNGKAPTLLWADDPVDVFFLHIQGSGRAELPDGRVVRLNYAAQNGHAYTAIGKTLIDRGALTADNVSMQSIRAWLAANPGEAAGVMRTNASYVFFREVTASANDGPPGAQGVPLTAGRSLAVDRAFLPLGLPLWLDAVRPNDTEGAPDVLLQRLVVAQDTGGAIKGPVRGDMFWGHGPLAGSIAGRMKAQGRYFLLLPRAVAARLLANG